MMRSVLLLLGLCGVLAGCSVGANEGASSTPARANHGGYAGVAAAIYDQMQNQCRQFTRNVLAQHPSDGNASRDNLLAIAVSAPVGYKQAARDGCDSGQASAKRMYNCKASQSGSTSELDCVYPTATEP